MNRIFLLILSAVFLFFAVYGIFGIFQEQLILDRTITIPKGASLQKVAKILSAKKIISSPTLFLIFSKLFSDHGSISYGQFKFNGKFNIPKVIDKLTSAKIVEYKITIPEGFTVKQIAHLLDNKNLADYQTFLSLTQDTLFIEELGLQADNLEGFLFPDTYHIPYFSTEKDIIRILVDNFFFHIENLTESDKKFPSFYSNLILASIVQSEARYEDEMPLIAGVYTNRLKKNMRLQADPTVAYALSLEDQSREKIYYEDLKIKSNYNTYLYKGLPPTPICNPGIVAIKGALKPKKTDYIFFFAGEDSRHVFSRTYNEHLQKMGRL